MTLRRSVFLADDATGTCARRTCCKHAASFADPQLERQLPCQHSVVNNALRCWGNDRDRLFEVLTEVTLGLEKARTLGVAMLLALLYPNLPAQNLNPIVPLNLPPTKCLPSWAATWMCSRPMQSSRRCGLRCRPLRKMSL